MSGKNSQPTQTNPAPETAPSGGRDLSEGQNPSTPTAPTPVKDQPGVMLGS